MTSAGTRPARPPAERRADLVELYRRLTCGHECPLAEARTNVVFGAGDADAEVMFVGEAPGANEDRQGRPFVGRAGQLLDTLLEEIGLAREGTFVANVLKCRPPGNRDPLPHEIEECTPHLMRQVELIEPRVICTLGNFALKLLSGSRTGITKVHGVPQTIELGGRSVVLYPLFHPSAALRTPAVLELLRADFARLRQVVEEAEEVAGPAPAASAAGTSEGSRVEEPERSPGRHRPGEPAADDQLDLLG